MKAAVLLVVSGVALSCSGGARTPVDTSDPSGGSSSSGGSSGGSSGTASSSGVTPAPGVTATGQITDALSGATLPGASVCLLQDPSTCVTTDATGSFTILGLQATGSGLTASLSGYVTGVWPATPVGNISYSIELRTAMRVANLARAIGATFGAGDGAVVFEVYDANGNDMSGVSVSAGAGGSVGYFPAAGATTLDPSLAVTTSTGAGWIFNVPAGTTGLTFTAPGLTCERVSPSGWAGGAGQTMTLPIVGGEVTRARAQCI